MVENLDGWVGEVFDCEYVFPAPPVGLASPRRYYVSLRERVC